MGAGLGEKFMVAWRDRGWDWRENIYRGNVWRRERMREGGRDNGEEGTRRRICNCRPAEICRLLPYVIITSQPLFFPPPLSAFLSLPPAAPLPPYPLRQPLFFFFHRHRHLPSTLPYSYSFLPPLLFSPFTQVLLYLSFHCRCIYSIHPPFPPSLPAY